MDWHNSKLNSESIYEINGRDLASEKQIIFNVSPEIWILGYNESNAPSLSENIGAPSTLEHSNLHSLNYLY